MSVRVPKYRLHKATGQALVEIRGRRTYLGKYDSPSSHERYRQIIAEFMSATLASAPTPQKSVKPLQVDELILLYFQFAKSYYVKDDEPTNEIVAIRAALRRLRAMYGSTPVSEFGPKAFKLVRESLIQERLSRKYVNDSMARVARMFRWAVAEELIAPVVFQALGSVPGLRKGRTNAKETAPIGPVSDVIVEATLPFLPDVVADMVRLQRLTGMRPAEVCILRPGDIDRSGEIWTYRPSRHKTEHAGKDRTIAFGPKAQEILLRYLARPGEMHCFRPCDSERRRRSLRHAARQTPLSCGNKPAIETNSRSKRPPGECYSPASYRRAIHRACDKAFPHPVFHQRREPTLTDAERLELAEWARSVRWAPNQLRHSAATEIRRRFGLEAAQVILGHSAANVTQIYAERDSRLAVTIATAIG
ncbi:tyrosine-type recombinase/integrase [Lacipirellula parvula]|uniref:Tyr recombinase domain-containing protein n=1 Tax=Lacipirellula parvula TaxID=2650471 RepID=A0A5K7XAS4_9BACT|nr:site-specific integrase [Lacipirellula parvula]BBO33790.1 hypothetical protein PLANPX_3402 [Lacipirellula parvula]